MKQQTVRWALIAAVCLIPLFGSIARADVSCTTCTGNVQDGENESRVQQNGSGTTGDGVGGQVVGVVSSGNASVNANNKSEDVSISTGDARGTNSSITFTGLNVGATNTLGIADVAVN